ncbi:MAG: SiaB family protein kinase, partial [Flavobacteriales bacterium]
MRINTAHTLYEAFGTDQCAWVHAGRFHDEHTADLILLGEAVAERTGVSRDIRNRLAFVMVEAFQNVIRHGFMGQQVDVAPTTLGPERPMILLRACAAGFTVATANTMRNEDEDKLVRILADLHGKPKDQLKELFLQRLQGNKVSERGGAGLGLIEMARRSGRELLYTVSRRDERTSTFTLQVGIAANGQAGREDHSGGTDEIQRIIAEEEVLMAYRGTMSPSVVQAMVRMLEKGVDDRPE